MDVHRFSIIVSNITKMKKKVVSYEILLHFPNRDDNEEKINLGVHT